jgi:hypothetical protein
MQVGYLDMTSKSKSVCARVFLVAMLFLIPHPAWSDPDQDPVVLGNISKESNEGVDNYEIQVKVTGLNLGDIVEVSHDAKVIGEATIIKLTPDSITISLKGSFVATIGDKVVFARRPEEMAKRPEEARGQRQIEQPTQNVSEPQANNQPTPAEQYTMQQELARRADAAKPHLVGVGFRPDGNPEGDWVRPTYIADTGYIRADINIKNEGGSESESGQLAVCSFVDWYGRPFAQDTRRLPSLKPGESCKVSFFSLVEQSDQNPNGVIKADKYSVKLTFK